MTKNKYFTIGGRKFKRQETLLVVAGAIVFGLIVGFIYAYTSSVTAYSPRGLGKGGSWSTTKNSSFPCGPYYDDGRETYNHKTASGACPEEGVTVAASSSYSF